jgi:hypothetical protein
MHEYHVAKTLNEVSTGTTDALSQRGQGGGV